MSKYPISNAIKELRFKRQTLENEIHRDLERKIEAFEKETGVIITSLNVTTEHIDSSSFSETITSLKIIPQIIIKI